MAANDDDLGTVVALLLRAAAGDAWELPRALLELGVRLASAAVALAANNGASPRPLDAGGGGVFARHRWELVAGLGALGVLVAWAGLWVSGKPHARRAAGMAALYAAVVPFAVADGLRRGFAENDNLRVVRGTSEIQREGGGDGVSLLADTEVGAAAQAS